AQLRLDTVAPGEQQPGGERAAHVGRLQVHHRHVVAHAHRRFGHRPSGAVHDASVDAARWFVLSQRLSFLRTILLAVVAAWGARPAWRPAPRLTHRPTGRRLGLRTGRRAGASTTHRPTGRRIAYAPADGPAHRLAHRLAQRQVSLRAGRKAGTVGDPPGAPLAAPAGGPNGSLLSLRAPARWLRLGRRRCRCWPGRTARRAFASRGPTSARCGRRWRRWGGPARWRRR